MDRPPTRVFGVDFAVAKRNAGRDLWIADGAPSDDGLVITALAPAVDFLDIKSTARAETLASLSQFIAGQTDAAFGLDVPFGVGSDLVVADRWTEFVARFPESLVVNIDETADRPAKQLYEAVKAGIGDPKRVGVRDDVDEVGLSPTDWRMKELTFYGIRDVLQPLVADAGDGTECESDHVAVVPMEAAESASVVVFETYPSAVFDELGANVDGYKGDGDEQTAARRANVAALEAAGVDFATPDLRRDALVSDDALDAVAACYATHATVARGVDFDHEPGRFGEIYV